jgi:hypothetical protein
VKDNGVTLRNSAVEEMRYARNELGMRAGFLRPNPYNNRMLGHRDYDIFWAEAQELDFSIGIHEGTGGMPAVGVDRFESFGARHMVSHTMEMMLATLSIIWGGVCERFPKVRIGFLESGGGWMAPWLDRMDRHFEDKALFNDSSLTMAPSEYFQRQCWISYEPVEGNLTHLVDYVGPHKILWATDYPHPDGFFPEPRPRLQKSCQSPRDGRSWLRAPCSSTICTKSNSPHAPPLGVIALSGGSLQFSFSRCYVVVILCPEDDPALSEYRSSDLVSGRVHLTLCLWSFQPPTREVGNPMAM